MDEFELIRRFFSRSADALGIVTGVGDDGAVIRPEPGRDQVQVIDTLVEGVHFPADISAADVGYRAVAVNLSDIAAMGAVPRYMTLALTLSQKDQQWVSGFADGLYAAASEFDVALIGGDTTSGTQLVATVHVTGDVETGQALLRSGASVGDSIFVTGTPGDAAAGLQLLERGEQDDYLVGRFLRPSARIETGRRLLGRAGAAIDVSDGLAGDLGKLLDASGVGGTLDIERLPISAALEARFDEPERHRLALTGGDDYELCFTARPEDVEGIDGVTAIGTVVEGSGLQIRNRGVVVEYDDSGYRHSL
ncbi:MAG: thiamine-phosphate kinase [Gammaproteobacteria bacterium]|nr:thiamine-phosphate kinase [Gammaproteobacteria bacterium]